MWNMHLHLALSIPVPCVSKIMSTLKRISCPLQNWNLPCYSECPLKRIRAATDMYFKGEKKDRSFLTSIWPCNPHVFCSSYLPGCIFCYCYISVKRGTDRLVRNAHSAAVASLCPWRVSNFLLIFLPFYIFTNARVKQWITQEMPGHVQINSFAIYNPLLFVFVHFVDVGCRNQCAENDHKGLHQEMKNYFSILCTFFFCPLLAFS